MTGELALVIRRPGSCIVKSILSPLSRKASGRRVTLRTIARAARGSVMTVSYALRGSPEVPQAEGARLRQLAASMGYRPDPLLSHLMNYLRSGKRVRGAGNLAVLADLRAEFVERQIAGARERASQLGYTLDRIDPRTPGEKRGALTRILRARGISGVLLAGRSAPADCTELIDWSQFATVAMTYSIIEPRLNRVVTHHFDNAVRTFTTLAGRGFRRIGLAMTPDMELRANHSYAAAFNHFTRIRGLKAVPTLLLTDGGARTIVRWFERQRPDALVVANAEWFQMAIVAALGEAALRDVAVATLDTERALPIAGMDQLYETIGHHAVDSVVAQIHRNERGLPDHPMVALIEGRWEERGGLYPLRASRA